MLEHQTSRIYLEYMDEYVLLKYGCMNMNKFHFDNFTYAIWFV